VLTVEEILGAAEDVLRRFGPAKATVLDVAQTLGVSHGSVYRHFPSKAALRDAVTEQWLARVSSPLALICAENGPAAERMRRWLDTLVALKRRNALEDPELFATYQSLATGARSVIAQHVARLESQLTRIVSDGVAGGEFAATNAASAARAVFSATYRFHHPVHAPEWIAADIDADYAQVRNLVMKGLRPEPNVVDPPTSGPPRNPEQVRMHIVRPTKGS